MRKMVYLVYDTEADDYLVGVFSSRERAQYAIYERLAVSEEDTYFDTLLEIAEENGFDSVKDFQEAIKTCGDYNDDLEMMIVVEELQD